MGELLGERKTHVRPVDQSQFHRGFAKGDVMFVLMAHYLFGFVQA